MDIKIMEARKYFIIFIVFFFIMNFQLKAEEKNSNEMMSLLSSSNKSEVDDALSYISVHKPQELLPRISLIILRDKDPEKKEIALKALKYYPYKETTSHCIEILKNTNSFIIKKEIIDYLSGSSDRQAVPFIINELESPFFTVRGSAILALKKIGGDRMFPKIINMMENPNPVFKIYALEAIDILYDLRFYNYLINILKDENKSVRYYVLKCIETNKLKDALPNVRDTALNDNSWEVRIKAIQVLENLLDRDSMQVLLLCLKDADREVRYYSSKALNTLKFKSSAVPISISLYSESDDEIKELLMNALIAINDAGGYKGIKEVLFKDDNYKMKVVAAYALGRIKNNWSASLLLEAINDSSREVRAEICNSLGFYNNKNIIKTLITLVNDEPDTYVRSAALFSIKRIGAKYAILLLFDRYTVEIDPVFKEQLEHVLRSLIKESI